MVVAGTGSVLLSRDGFRFSVDRENARGTTGQARFRTLGGQDDRRSRVIDHRRDALHRIAGINRNVCAASLEDREQPDHHFHGTFDGDPNQSLGLDADGAQVPRELIGLLIEFAIGQAAPCANHRDCVRCARNLLLERLYDCAARTDRRFRSSCASTVSASKDAILQE